MITRADANAHQMRYFAQRWHALRRSKPGEAHVCLRLAINFRDRRNRFLIHHGATEQAA